MFEKFKSGLAFGAGFGISFLIIVYGLSIGFTYFAGSFLGGDRVTHFSSDVAPSVPSENLTEDTEPLAPDTDTGDEAWDFFELPLQEQLDAASFVALAEYREEEGGRRVAYLTDILKREDGHYRNFDVGDEWYEASYFPGDSEFRVHSDKKIVIIRARDGGGSSMTYEGERIASLGGITVERLRQMCKTD